MPGNHAWLRKMMQLQVRIAQSKALILGSNIGAVVLGSVYVQLTHSAAATFALAGAASISLGATSLVLKGANSLNLKQFKRMFKEPRVGYQAMLLAHDMLFALTGERQDKRMANALRTIQGAVYGEADWYPGVFNNSEAFNVRIEATGVALQKRMSGTVEMMANQIVRETLFHFLGYCISPQDKLTRATQQYILANDPDWVQQKPHLFDGPSVELTYPGLMGAVIAFKTMGLDDTEQGVAVRQWLDDRLGAPRTELVELPALSL